MKLRVCYFGTYRARYVRNRLMIDRLELHGVDVVKCHVRLWYDMEDRERMMRGGWKNPKFWYRIFATYLKLLLEYLKVGHYDVMLVGYPGHFDIPIARIFSWIARKPLVWDVLMSIYLISLERNIQLDHPFMVNFLKKIEGFSLQISDYLIFDTHEYANWFVSNYRFSPDKYDLIPLGADDRLFHPSHKNKDKTQPFRCIYYGTFIPSHGLKNIIDAAALLKNHSDIHFVFVGQGPDKKMVSDFARANELNNVSFIDWMSVTELVDYLADIDVCLGTFGDTPQGIMTVQNKIYESLAMGKALITGDSPAMRDQFNHKEHVFLCKREDPQSLADAIIELKEDRELKARISNNGIKIYNERFTFKILSNRLYAYLKKISLNS